MSAPPSESKSRNKAYIAHRIRHWTYSERTAWESESESESSVEEADGMGNCASCLGLGRHRHPSQDREIDRLLSSDSARAAYGTVDHGSLAQPDEEELRREREALEHITAHAADHMIDVIHPSQSDLDYGMADHKHDHSADHSVDNTRADENPRGGDLALDTEDPNAAAWLESIQSAQLEAVQVPKRGALVMDINLLRDSHPSQRGTRAESGV